MNEYQRYELKKLDPQSDEYTLIIYADADFLSEFGDELGTIQKENTSLISKAKQIIKERYPNIKVTMVKVVVGGIAVTALPFIADNPLSAKAAEPATVTSQVSQASTPIYYEVKAGDTLWNVSNKFHTSIDQIKQANKLSTDTLQLNQRLIIPQAFHTVGSGDYLTVLAKKYNISVDAIKEANGLTSDATNLGQILIIPLLMNNSSTSTPVSPVTNPTNQDATTSYTVVSGDSLSLIAKRFSTTVEALKSTNNLTSDVLRVGQSLKISTNGTTVAPPTTEQNVTATYTVVSGDSLSVIAKRFSTTVEALKSTNNLTSDVLRVGQSLKISTNDTTTAPPTTEQSVASTYTVVSGDSLSVIAKRFNVSIDQIKNANQLTSDSLRVGQVLTIPKAQTPTNGETVQSNATLASIQKNLQTLGYYTVPTMTGTYDTSTTAAIKSFQSDYLLPVTGTVDDATNTAINHAIVKQGLIKDTMNYAGVPYVWGGTTPSGFDCSGFVYYMFNQHGVSISRNTSGGLFNTGTSITRSQLQPGDLVFFAVNNTGTISHVGFYMGNNQFISATSSKGIAAYSMDNSYWAQYYVGAKRIY